jgi:hypothetical protein
MKPKILIVIGMLMLLAPFHAMSESKSTSTQINRLMRRADPKKHRMPSAVYIEYSVDSDGIQFLPSSFYTEAEVTVSDASSMVVAEGTITEENGYFLPAVLTTGEYSITCTTDEGSVFIGSVELD